MPRAKTYQTEAIILKKTKLGEADRILTLYTPELGKIQGVAKGIRRPKAKLAGHLEMLTHSTVSLASGRNLDTITGSQTIDSFLPLKDNLDLSSYALYVTELVDQFTVDEHENRPLFFLLRDTLQRLCQDAECDVTLRFFEMQLLNETGYRPQLEQCITCHTPVSDAADSYWFSPSAGGLLCGHCSPPNAVVNSISGNALKVLRFLQGAGFDDLSRLKMGESLAHEVQEIVRRYLRYIMEREIKSAAWLDMLKESNPSFRAWTTDSSPSLRSGSE